MSIDKLIHLHFLSLYVAVLIIFLIVLYKKMRVKKIPKKLTQEKYNATLIGKMVEIEEPEKNMFNIWPYVTILKRVEILPKKSNERELVYKVYRNLEEKYEHILLTTEKENHYVVIVVNLIKNKIKGYFPLELKNEYYKK